MSTRSKQSVSRTHIVLSHVLVDRNIEQHVITNGIHFLCTRRAFQELLAQQIKQEQEVLMRKETNELFISTINREGVHGGCRVHERNARLDGRRLGLDGRQQCIDNLENQKGGSSVRCWSTPRGAALFFLDIRKEWTSSLSIESNTEQSKRVLFPRSLQNQTDNLKHTLWFLWSVFLILFLFVISLVAS